ncbi:response regulator transcription factor [Chryseobacterium takakiae]|uniref:Response regulator receiver domain-containing protein n=1 Tax=Chryseobacterium takakiae TaxID=1302685 RepID=A0A1M5ATJ3_9FLAO|nr:response regulator [Chryseobacterium takakiae]SHF33272.1 Response regulator receiver domain-containing protein [Chryseobacterium takakiae]
MRKIYIVEDNESIREILEIVLSSENYEVKSFGTVGEFSGRDVTVMPDLYLFDVMLPDGSGIDLCQEVKKDQNNLGIPVIIMSAHAHLTQMKELCQPDDFIAKPFDIDDVLERIQGILH